MKILEDLPISNGKTDTARGRPAGRTLAIAAALVLVSGLLAACTGDNAGAQPDHRVNGFYGAASAGWSR